MTDKQAALDAFDKGRLTHQQPHHDAYQYQFTQRQIDTIRAALTGDCGGGDKPCDNEMIAWMCGSGFGCECLKKDEAYNALTAPVVDVDRVYLDLIKKLDEYKNADTSRQASWYDDKKPTLLWAVEFLAARGLIAPYLPRGDE